MSPQINISGHFYRTSREVIEDPIEVLDNFYNSRTAQIIAEFDMFYDSNFERMVLDWEA
jgi:hypothetical protein